MFRFQMDGVTVECDSADELKSVFGNGKVKTTAVKAGGKRTSGRMKAAWAAARKLAKTKNISIMEARKQLKKAK